MGKRATEVHGVTIAAVDLISVLWPLGALIVVLITGLLAWKWFRARMLTEGQNQGIGPLEELRRLRDQGELTREEYERARQRLVDRIRASGVEIPPEVEAMRAARQAAIEGVPRPPRAPTAGATGPAGARNRAIEPGVSKLGGVSGAGVPRRSDPKVPDQRKARPDDGEDGREPPVDADSEPPRR